MSERNGDRARYHKDRTRKLHRRQRIQAFAAAVRQRKDAARVVTGALAGTASEASAAMHDEGGPMRSGD